MRIRGLLSFIVALTVTLSLATAAAVPAAAQATPIVTGDARVDKLLSKMTLAEKISLIHGDLEDASTYQGQAGYWRGLPRLRIPSLRLADGPPGVLTRQPSTALTCTMGLAATFSREDAMANGRLVAADAMADGIDVVLQPFVNIYRDPGWRRAYNTYGEDPLLSGQIAASFISGVQRDGKVMAQAKHWIGYDGASNNTFIPPQALHEIYVAPFKDAVEAGVSSIMCSYNKVNGIYACGNGSLLKTILRDELHFKGFVTSDWGANHGTEYIDEGLDLEMPSVVRGITTKTYFRPDASHPAPANKSTNTVTFQVDRGIPEEWTSFQRPAQPPPDSPDSLGMTAALEQGKVSEAMITQAVGHILYELDRFGLLDRAPKHAITPVPVAEDRVVVQKTSEDAAVLLKNDGILPLHDAAFAGLALIGPGAAQTIAIGRSGEKAVGIADARMSPLAALRAMTKTPISFAVADDMTGTPIPAAMLSHDDKPGLERIGTTGTVIGIDADVNFARSTHNALPAGSSFTWKGLLTVPADGDYYIYLQILGAKGGVRIDGKQVEHTSGLYIHGDWLQPNQDNVLPTTDNLDDVRTQVHLTAGPHALAISTEAEPTEAPVQVRLAWVTPVQRKANFDEAVRLGRSAKTAVIFAWARGVPAFELPGDQDALIDAIASSNPNTIVVLNVSDPAMLPWLSKVRAVVNMWYPGDSGGPATANILTGRADPGGRLPFTWVASEDQNVAHDRAHPERTSLGINFKTTYSEGIFMGYRRADKEDLTPTFPFGYGLSYTSFQYSNLVTTNAPDGGLDIRFMLKNTGNRNGDEVPQIYIGPPAARPSGVQFAVRSLAAFDRVHLKAGEQKLVLMHVPVRSLQYWSEPTKSWVRARAGRSIAIGASSRDIRLRGSIAR